MAYQEVVKEIGILPSGQELKIKFYELGDLKSKNIIFVNSGVHGGEATFWIIKDLFEHYKNASLNDLKLILCPLSNPASWNQRMYSRTIGKYNFEDGKDWNRDFPGDENGSLAQRISAAAFSGAKDAKLFIDLHTSRESVPFSIIPDPDLLKYAKHLGVDWHYVISAMKDSGHTYFKTFTGACYQKDIAAITLECGTHDNFNKAEIERMTKGIIKLIDNYTNIENLADAGEGKIFNKLETIRAVTGGFTNYLKVPGDSFKQGDLLCEIYPTYQLEQTIQIKAEKAGTILKKLTTHIVWPGDELYQIIPE